MGMKYLALLACIACAAPASAQQARVVAVCGNLAPFGPIAAGGQAYPTIDVNGQLCLSGASLTAMEQKLGDLEDRVERLEGKKR